MQANEKMRSVEVGEKPGEGKWRFPTGKVRYKLTNDFMFKAVLQRNIPALKGLLGALLGLAPEEIRSVRILNPIEEGDVIDDKAVVLDVKVELNSSDIIDIEMQVEDEGDWEERSLTYLCREFDRMKKGESYKSVKKCVHIGILNFTPKGFPQTLYADYFFYHFNSGHKYSDKLSIYVLQLNQIGKEEDEKAMPELYYWAQLFRASTWEELRMLAEKNKEIQECVFTMKKLTADEKTRMQCEAREDYYRRLADAQSYGIEEGSEQAELSAIQNLIQKLKMSVGEAMETLEIPGEKRGKYSKLLQNK